MRKFSFLLLMSCAMLILSGNSTAQNLPSYLPSNGLVAWYPFNGNANDESGNGSDLIVNGPQLSFDRFNNSNSCYSFNGTPPNAQYLITSNIENLKNGSYTYSAWVNTSEFYPNVAQTNPYQFEIFYVQGIFSINNASNWSIGPAINFGLFASDNSKLQSGHWVQNQSSYQYTTSQSGLIQTNQWYNLIISYANGVHKVYCNGSLIAQANFTISYQNQDDFIIGGQRNGPQMDVMGGFKGRIDDIAIYNRALTQEEITALYTGTPVNNNNGGNTTANAVPPGIPYQAVVRNANGQVAANAAATTKFTLHQNTTDGAVEYQETHALTTNAQGLVSAVIGQGTAVQGTFAGINWSNTTKFLQVEVDLGDGYVDLGTQQLMSVPFALYAANGPAGPQGPAGADGADGATGPQGPVGPAGSGGFTHWVGESFGGGVVFHVYKDALGEEHGLIVSLTDLSTSAPWSFYWIDVPNCESLWNGEANTISIVESGAGVGSAAHLCGIYSINGYDDWYLPSIDELNLIYLSRYNLNQSLSQLTGGQVFGLESSTYWSSTETSEGYVWTLDGADGGVFYGQVAFTKLDQGWVRAIRSF